MAQIKKYRPSNSDDIIWFLQTYCENCTKGKYEHTHDDSDKPCDILTRALIFGTDDKEYPLEWIYDKEGDPTCAAFKEHKWIQDDEGNWIDAPFVDPNQLSLFQTT